MKRVFLVLAAIVFFGPGVAHGSDLRTQLTRATQAASKPDGHEAYTRIRELWRQWETEDPNRVEAALAALASDPTIEPPLRVYASVLEAYARRRRGDITGAQKRIKALGFVDRWMVVGPFDNENRPGLSEETVPERELSEPIVVDRSFEGKERSVRWRVAPDVHPWGWLDLGAMMNPHRHVCVLASTFVRSDRARWLSLWIGATGAFKVYWDGEVVLEDATYRQLDADRFAVPVFLSDGFHRITVKVCGKESPPTLALRLGEKDGSPADVSFEATQEASTAAARQSKKTSAPAPRGRSKVRGPMQAFEAHLRDDDAASMEQFARYLMTTGGDGHAEHRARDLAARAAELKPTVERLLLAAELAEDRNTRRPWIEKATARASTDGEKIQAWLAEAKLARSGINWREAIPIYGSILELDPNDIAAMLGKTDLYVEAGLKRTALGKVEALAAAHPHSVAVLRALSGQLRALGRDTDAVDVEARYAMLRFDDTGYIKDKLDVAVARRDKAEVERWAERLLALEPASSWAYGVVAEARRASGDAAAAIATYQAMLEIAPEDVTTLQSLANIFGQLDRRDEQLASLKRILRLRPQAKGVRSYVEHIEPASRRNDEEYAWAPEKFLEKRVVPDGKLQQVTLHQLTVTTVFDNGLANHFHQVVFQPLTDAAAAQARQFAFTYHADRQVVQVRAAKVYRRDGRIDESIETGEVPVGDPSINMYTLQRSFFVQFPRIEAGDVVELRYRIDDVSLQNDRSDYFGEVTYLQGRHLIDSFEYVLIAPRDKKLFIDAKLPSLKREEKVVDGRTIYRFSAQHVPPIDGEPGMPPASEVVAKIHVSTFEDWNAVARWYWGLAHRNFDVDDEVRKLAHELTKGLTEPRDKVAAIYHYAASGTRYVALEFGIEGIRPRRAALTLARGWGDCKDKATLIISLLRELGIEAQIVLVRTGLRGRFDASVASLEPFDHAIAYVPSLDLFLDGTAEDTGTGELPAMDRDALALVVHGESGGRLVRLPHAPAADSIETRTFGLKLASNGSIAFDAAISNQGASAPAWRRRFQSASTQRDRAAADMSSVLGPVELLPGDRGMSVRKLEDVELPIEVSLAGKAKAKREGDEWTIDLGPRHRLLSRFATRARRKHDLLLGPKRTHRESWTVELPAGWKATSTPAPVKLETPFGRFELKVSVEGAKVVLDSELELSRPRIAPSDYAAWRAFCQVVEAASSPKLIVGPQAD
ncbi:DUF3857 domain-containing protein [Desulfobulbus sp. AH-315-M07]|nr:DUF3857 domain-containing protein [Desulfobulbus sp. AH-315-M07]